MKYFECVNPTSLLVKGHPYLVEPVKMTNYRSSGITYTSCKFDEATHFTVVGVKNRAGKTITVRKDRFKEIKPQPKRKRRSFFERLEEHSLIAKPPLMLDGKVRKHRTVKMFLKTFFTEYNREYSTRHLNKRLQCHLGRRRSLGDLYRIVKHYYPKATLKEVLRVLYVELPEELKGFRISFCSEIKRKVFYYSYFRNTFVGNTRDEFGITPNEYKNELE